MHHLIGFALVIVGLYLAFKVAGLLLKLFFWAIVIFGVFWLLAPLLGWPHPL